MTGATRALPAAVSSREANEHVFRGGLREASESSMDKGSGERKSKTERRRAGGEGHPELMLRSEGPD